MIPADHGKVILIRIAACALGKELTLPFQTSKVFILGPAYSGKSRFLHTQMFTGESAVIFGCADTSVAENAAAVQELQSQRPAMWKSVDAHDELLQHLKTVTPEHGQVAIDSVSHWLSAELVRGLQKYDAVQLQHHLMGRLEEFVTALKRLPPSVSWFAVSSELGACPPSAHASERLLRKFLGVLQQEIAAQAETVWLMNAGIAQLIKSKN